jgi:hypothetical protein
MQTPENLKLEDVYDAALEVIRFMNNTWSIWPVDSANPPSCYAGSDPSAWQWRQQMGYGVSPVAPVTAAQLMVLMAVEAMPGIQ